MFHFFDFFKVKTGTKDQFRLTGVDFKFNSFFQGGQLHMLR